MVKINNINMKTINDTIKFFKKYKNKKSVIINVLSKKIYKNKNRNYTIAESTKIYKNMCNTIKKYNNSYKFNSNKFISDKNKIKKK